MTIFLAAVVSAFVQYLKKDIHSEYVVIALCACLSLIAAAVYTALVDVNLWQQTLGIFTIAGAFYAYIWARFESTPASTFVGGSADTL